jgi:hypothetical protein
MGYNAESLIDFGAYYPSKEPTFVKKTESMKEKTKQLISKWGPIALFVVVLFLLGIAFMKHFWLAERIDEKLSESLGHAFIIAGVLTAFVDYYVKKHLVKEASKDIAEFVIGYPLPPQIRSALVDLIRQKKVVYDTVLTYEIIPHPTDDAKITLKVEKTSNVENIGGSSIEHKQELRFEKHTNPKVEYLNCTLPDGTNKYHKDNPTLQEIETGVLSYTCEGVNLKAKSSDEPTKYIFECSYSFECPAEYNEHFFFLDTALGVTIRAKYPPDKFEFFSENNKIPNNQKHEYKQVFLKGQQVGVRWRRKIEQSPAKA